MSSTASSLRLRLTDHEPTNGTFREDFRACMRARPRQISPKWLYDERGSELFEEICQLEEYYPTRTETTVMKRYIREISSLVGADARVIEFGSGSGRKIRFLLDHLRTPVAYVPVEISREFLCRSASQLAERYKSLEVLPVCADYTADFDLPAPGRPYDRSIAFFPGSTIGNFTRGAAFDFLQRVRGILDPGDGLLIGVDLVKEKSVLERAYNDSQGVTAAFNLNLLVRARRELNVPVDPERFRHEAVWDAGQQRIEMRLVSEEDQIIPIEGDPIPFTEGEFIITEYSHKYTIEDFAAMGERAGFEVEQCWTDERDWFAVFFLQAV